jgi:uncharacterized protein
MKSFAGLAGYLATVHLDWGLTLAVTAAAVIGSLMGGRLVGRIPEIALRKAFGWFVLAMGGFVLLQQAPGQVRWGVVAAAGVFVALATACWRLVDACPLRRLTASDTSA